MRPTLHSSRNFLFVIAAVLNIVALAYGQSGAVERASEVQPSYPIPGSHLLWRDDQMVREYFKAHPEAIHQMRLAKTTAWGFVVGSTHSWKAVNTSTNVFYSVASTCRAVGTNCYVFVEDASWGTRVTQASVDSVTKAFDQSTPANAAKGIYQTDVDAFGNPPDVDSDPKIIILMLDIQDGYSGTGGYVAGYFHSVNELPISANANSNAAEIYYLDCNPADLTTAAGITNGMSTTAHEFQHMIHFNYDQNEISFINEGCSEVAEVNAGYSLRDQSAFVGEANHYLFDWRYNDNVNVLRDYSRASRYTLYLREQFSMNIFKPLVQSTLTGAAGVSAALTAISSSKTFNDVLQNWLIANVVNSTSVNSAYGYAYPNLSPVSPKVYFNPNVASVQRTVQSLAADYVSFRAGSNLSATFTLPVGSTLLIKAMKKGTGGTAVVDVTPNTPFTVPEFGSTITDVTFIVINTNPSSAQNYTVHASGTSQVVELKYDTTEPTGYLGNAAGDTVCVWFDAVPGAHLDSVRIALRRTGTVKASISKYSGTLRPSPNGTPLATGLTASVSSTPAVPYPVPWNNWGTIDVRSKNIIADQPFTISVLCEGVYTAAPRVMTTESPIPSIITSYTYSTTSASGANWYYYSSNNAGDSIYTYLIHAYASFMVDGVKKSIELVPGNLSLSQNYPNPFNPSTMIKYQLPMTGYVTLKVYDMLGREVATLVNTTVTAGEHSVAFNATALNSGVYFYTLTAGNVTTSKKMVFMK
ncbi:MAG: T9SS type A sorting domain-containing protein [Bacteroidota bacterium]|nr:T9SS type A sorting domain-containing protein [Bacteroidota bacterium]